MGPPRSVCSCKLCQEKLGYSCEKSGFERSFFRSSKEKNSAVLSRSAEKAYAGMSRLVRVNAARKDFFTFLFSALLNIAIVLLLIGYCRFYREQDLCQVY